MKDTITTQLFLWSGYLLSWKAVAGHGNGSTDFLSVCQLAYSGRKLSYRKQASGVESGMRGPVEAYRKLLILNGERRRNRTFNLLIKCQTSTKH